MSDFLFYGALTLLVAVFVAIFAWAFILTVGVLQRLLGVSHWEAVAVLIMASLIFGSTSASRSKS